MRAHRRARARESTHRRQRRTTHTNSHANAGWSELSKYDRTLRFTLSRRLSIGCDVFFFCCCCVCFDECCYSSSHTLLLLLLFSGIFFRSSRIFFFSCAFFFSPPTPHQWSNFRLLGAAAANANAVSWLARRLSLNFRTPHAVLSFADDRSSRTKGWHGAAILRWLHFLRKWSQTAKKNRTWKSKIARL